LNRELSKILLPQLHLRFRDKLALCFGAIVLASTTLAITLSFYSNLHLVIHEFGESLVVIANTASSEIDPNEFQSLKSPDQMSGAAYAHIRAQLIAARAVAAKSNVPLRYLYTMVPTDKPGVWRYIVDSQPETRPDGRPNDEFSKLGDEEKVKRGDVIIRSFANGVPEADDDVVDYPIWGPLLSVAVPIRDGRGRTIGIVGADAPAPALTELRRQLGRTALICVGVGLLVVVAGSSLVAYQVTRPIDALVHATRRVAEGDLESRTAIAGGDEIGQLGEAFNQMTAGLRLRDLYKHQFERYVSRQVADAILSHPDRDFWQGERRRATILFADIRGFTTLSEKLEPEEVVRRLNEYLSVMVDIVFAYDGTLDKFIGDAIMAVFGAPVSMGNDEERAVRAAVAIQDALKRLDEKFSQSGMQGFKIGIGINTGDVVVGNIGSEQRIEYAAIGDHVNLASRLESLNKEYNTGTLMTKETFQRVEHLVEARWVDRVAVRGREGEVDLYEVIRLRPDAGPYVPRAPEPAV